MTAPMTHDHGAIEEAEAPGIPARQRRVRKPYCKIDGTNQANEVVVVKALAMETGSDAAGAGE